MRADSLDQLERCLIERCLTLALVRASRKELPAFGVEPGRIYLAIHSRQRKRVP